MSPSACFAKFVYLLVSVSGWCTYMYVCLVLIVAHIYIFFISASSLTLAFVIFTGHHIFMIFRKYTWRKVISSFTSPSDRNYLYIRISETVFKSGDSLNRETILFLFQAFASTSGEQVIHPYERNGHAHYILYFRGLQLSFSDRDQRKTRTNPPFIIGAPRIGRANAW